MTKPGTVRKYHVKNNNIQVFQNENTNEIFYIVKSNTMNHTRRVPESTSGNL
jgi:hypothetical protein